MQSEGVTRGIGTPGNDSGLHSMFRCCPRLFFDVFYVNFVEGTNFSMLQINLSLNSLDIVSAIELQLAVYFLGVVKPDLVSVTLTFQQPQQTHLKS